jgi:thymidylate kinase
MVIYLTGIDGSGKSSLAKKIEKETFVNKNVISIWARYNPRIVKVLLAPFKRKYVSDTSNYHIMNDNQFSRWVLFKTKVTKNIFISKLFFLIQSIDYNLQLRKIMKTIRENHDKIIIIDRFYLDFIVDQSINYGDISNWWITKLFLKKLKIFDFIFYIDVEEEIAFGRKEDIPSKEYFTGKRYYYKQYISKLRNAHLVDNNSEISTAMDVIQQLLIS